MSLHKSQPLVNTGVGGAPDERGLALWRTAWSRTISLPAGTRCSEVFRDRSVQRPKRGLTCHSTRACGLGTGCLASSTMFTWWAGPAVCYGCVFRRAVGNRLARATRRGVWPVFRESERGAEGRPGSAKCASACARGSGRSGVPGLGGLRNPVSEGGSVGTGVFTESLTPPPLRPAPPPLRPAPRPSPPGPP